MAVFNVTAFEAEAEVLGKFRRVSVSNAGLFQIQGVTVDEAKTLLEHVSTGLTTATFGGKTAHSYDTPTATEEAASDVVPEISVDTPARTVASGKVDDLSGDLGQGGNPKKGAKEGSKTPAKASKPPKTKEKADQEDGQNDNVVDLAEKRGDGGGLVEQVAKFTKLVDVITTMREKGSFADDDALISECERVKDQVPVLKRISDIPGRVKRVLERLSA